MPKLTWTDWTTGTPQTFEYDETEASQPYFTPDEDASYSIAWELHWLEEYERLICHSIDHSVRDGGDHLLNEEMQKLIARLLWIRQHHPEITAEDGYRAVFEEPEPDDDTATRQGNPADSTDLPF